MAKKKVLILGAAGRDFHNFNNYFRGNDEYEVVGFTATQIPDIDDKKYPAEIAGDLYPEGIPIYSEDNFEEIIQKKDVDEVVFAYSDVSYDYLMHRASIANANGADFKLMGTETTMVKSEKPVISICAVRTGCGKSQTTRRVSEILKEMGKKVAVIRHPMPYGDLNAMRVQKFEKLEDLDKHNCTIEEMEEYEPHINRGNIVFAGVDYHEIIKEAEKVADVILWDGGNNDIPFYVPDINIVVADPHRPGHELKYYPGETNFRMADVIVINKIDSSNIEGIEKVRENIRKVNNDAEVVDAASPIFLKGDNKIHGKKVLVVEDGPTLTHGNMKYGAGTIAARKYGAKEIIDPREFAVGKIARTFKRYPGVGKVLPAMGYDKGQMKDLEKTINKSDAEVVVIGTPIDLNRLIDIKKPTVRVTYELQEIGEPTLEDIVKDKIN